MRTTLITFSVAALTVFASSVFLPEAAMGQARRVCQPFGGRCNEILPPDLSLSKTPMPSSIPRTPGGKPDFTGVWAGPGFSHQLGPNDENQPIFRGYDSAKMAPMTPLGQKEMLRPFTGDLRIDDPIAECLPYGFTSQILSGFAQQWFQSDKWLVIRHEFQNNFSRAIALDGRPHPEDLELTWGGHSVGHWEADTLVIDTVGLKEWWLDNPHSKGTLWHSDAIHVIERVRYINPRLVSYEVTIDDPKYFTKPWSEELHMVLQPTWDLMEFVCEENNRCDGGTCTPSDVQKKEQ